MGLKKKKKKKKDCKFSHGHTHGGAVMKQGLPMLAWLVHERATLSPVLSWAGEDIPEITGRASQLQGVTIKEREEDGRSASL